MPIAPKHTDDKTQRTSIWQMDVADLLSFGFTIAGGVLLISFFLSMMFRPMRRPAFMIRNHVLRHTPIGMNIDEVFGVINNNASWGSPMINRYSGCAHPNPAGSPWNYGSRVGRLIFGEQSIQSRPERYNVILWHERNVRIFWGFDGDGKLIEVYVRSTFSPRLA